MTIVVVSAAQRALFLRRFVVAAQRQDEGDADERQKDEPGENAEAEHQCRLPDEIIGDERRDADQHGEGIMIEIAALQPHDAIGDVDDARGDAVRAEADR